MLQKKGIFVFVALIATIGLVLTAGIATADLRVNVMPNGSTTQANIWDSKGPYTWPGNALELWGNVEYDGADPLTYTWNFGAGEGSASGTVTDPKNIAETHTYANTGSYVATLTVTDGTESDTDTVYIDVVPQSLDVEVNLAIQRGLKYLYMHNGTTTVNGCSACYWDGYYSTYYRPGYTGLAVLAFENHGHLEINDPDQDIFAETVERGLNYLFAYMYGTSATMDDTAYTDSDINGNGRKVYCGNTNMYIVGITTMAIAGTASPGSIVRDCGSTEVRGKPYIEVLEDMVDFIAYAQREGTSGNAGGWRYSPNYGSSDNSVSQWPALGVGEAERAPWSINAPAWVKTRLQIWINYSQCSTGGFGYTSACYWTNCAKTGAGIIEMVYAGGGGNLTNAVNFIANNWGSTSSDYGNIGDHYAMYAVKKGMEYANLSTVGGHDWQEEYNQWLVNNQYSSGTWPSSVRIGSGNDSCAFGLLVLAPLEVCKPLAYAGVDQEVTENNDVTFDGTGSTHTCPDDYSIALYEWDFDYDGINFDVDATGPVVTKDGGYTITNGTDTQDFTVALRVTDNQSPAKGSTDTLIVTVTNGNVAPVADPGGPYLGGVGEDIPLNGSGSRDDNEESGPNPIWNTLKDKWDEIELYQWDIDGDGLYGNEDSPADPEGVTVIVNFGPDFIGTKTVGLKVTDSFGRSAAQSAQVTTVAVSDLFPISYELVYKQYNRRCRCWCYAWRVTILNDGNGAATEVTAALTPDSVPDGVTVIDDSVSWDGSIDPGEEQLSEDEFRYNVDRGASDPDMTQMTWEIEFTDALGTRHVVRNVPQLP
ncbi:MAG: PKD domain-containing protein [Thermodesulfobacteriota bacterium]|nr:PKD domain-containing protein [Thermodesulfobacteriota bacterium]